MTITNVEKSDEKMFTLTRQNLTNRSLFRKTIEDYLGLEFIKEDKANKVPIFEINRSRIHDLTIFMKTAKYQLENIFVSDGISYFEVNYLYSCRRFLSNSTIIIQSKINKTIDPPSVSEIYPNAQIIEKNISKRLGINFKEFSRKSEEQKEYLCKPYSIQPPSAKDNPLKYGIFHPIHQDNYYVELFTENNRIQGVELRDGWLYKGIQPRLEELDPLLQYNTMFETLSEYSNVAINLAFVDNIESVLEKKIPNKVRYIRTLLAELERISHHLIWMVNLADLLGNKLKAKKIYRRYQKFEYYLKTIFHHPELFNTIHIGTSIDLTMKEARDFWRFTKKMAEKIFDAAYGLVYDKITMDLLEGLAPISRKQAIDWELTGPTLRASGVQVDVRATDPYLIYDKGEISQIWNVIAFKNGDCFSRAQVRLWEIKESFQIIMNILESLSIYERKAPIEEIPQDVLFEPNKHLYSAVEAPNGSFEVYLRTSLKDTDSRFYTVRIGAPDLANYSALGHILLENKPKYVPLIIHSMDINFNLVDL